MASSIWRNSTFTVFIVDGGESILTTVTVSGEEVEYWLDEILDIHRCRLRCLVVGLDTEWRPNSARGEDNSAALLQLCVGRRCLIFQIIHADYIPDDLMDFLSDERFTFVGVGIKDDAKRLEKYNLKVSNTADLRQLAVEKMEQPDLCKAGLKTLVWEVMGIYMPKSKPARRSDWNNRRLTDDQITYATVDAFYSFEVGRRLIAGEFGRKRDRSEDHSKVNMSDPVVDTSNFVLTKHQLGQRARREQERSEANTIISSSHGGITLTTHSEANPIEISNSDLSKHQLGQRACREWERLESKQTISSLNGGTTLTINLEGHSEANIYVPNIETPISGRERDRSEDNSKVNMSYPVVDTSNLVLTKHQLGQRARREHERSEANTIISSSHGGITLTTHSEANPIEISNSYLSKHQLGQRACRERERLESKQTISSLNGGTTLTTNLEGHSEANISVPNIETSNSGNAAVAEGTPLRMPRLSCCGINTGWLLFFIGFILAAIPWYVGAFILLRGKTDYREKPGFIACTIAAVLVATAVILGETKGADAW